MIRQALARCLHRLKSRGARRVLPSFNEQRVGIDCFELEGLEHLIRVGHLAADSAVELEVDCEPGPDGGSVLVGRKAGPPRHRLIAPAGELVRYGLRVHQALLPPGVIRLRAQIGSDRWSGKAIVPTRSSRAAAWAEACREHGTPVLFCGPCDASAYPYARSDLLPWFDRPDAHATIDAWQHTARINAAQAGQLRQFVDQGYLEIESAFDPALVAAARAQLLQAAAQGHQGFVPGSSMRLEQLHRPASPIRQLWLNQACRSWIERLFDGPARPVQTLGFVNGSQQDPHQDTIHLTPFPAGYMCGLWIPLEDVQPGSGELLVYPGSHRRPRLRMGDLACPKVQDQDWGAFGRQVVPVWQGWSAEQEPVAYRPRAGSALIWHENLLHAGSPRRDTRLSRCSVVIHYYAADAVAYADSTGEPAMAASEQDLRTASSPFS